MLDTLFSRIKEALFPGSEAVALPMMDGALKPNRRLDDAAPIGAELPGCDDVVALVDGTVLVSVDQRILRLGDRSTWCECPGTVGALAVAADDSVYAAIAGAGVLRIVQGIVTSRLEQVDGRPLRCVTALAVLADGRIAVSEGSSANPLDDWARDLLEHRASGRVVVATADLSSASTLASDLAWPAGLLARGNALWISEAWRHRVLSQPIAGGAPIPVLHNLPGYPARLSADPDGGAWLSLIAVRTQMLEFVLRERAYREEMLATIDPRYWIAPSLRATGHYLEPLQGGAIKKLGIVKPWAPPRSYGLVVRLNAAGEIVDSLHSRAGGVHHGITATLRRGAHVIAVSKGAGRVLQAIVEVGR
ncbi:MAG: hypothetical protein K0Q76_2834 [Panacagrimonas sp.]|nr:hypothetical protein [Panacagrimonas sp.]MCC2657726.1 hypothetical protein [Panacagrimonas sp.]